MAEDQKPGTEKSNKTGFVLDLRRTPVETSHGTFYVRHITVSDLDAFNGAFGDAPDGWRTNLRAIGEWSVMNLVCLEEDRSTTTSLTSEVYGRFTDEDVSAVVVAVAKKSGFRLTLAEDALSDLGSALVGYIAEQKVKQKQVEEAIKRTLDMGFGAVPASVQTALGDSLKGMSAIGDALKMSSLGAGVANHKGEPERLLSSVLPLQLPKLPKYEETPAGRTAQRAAMASEAAARQLSEVTSLMAQMAGKMQELQAVVLTEVLPTWNRNLQDGSDNANKTLRQAKWALIISIVATVLMTMWQLWVAREYKLEGDAQQNTSELLLRQQLAASQELNKQLAADSKQLREEVSRLRKSDDRPHSSSKH